MCGIAGIFHLRGGALPEFSPKKILDSIRHRGPDDEGIFIEEGICLGARRLAIIDPAQGHQPVQDESGRYHLVMNGEIFDYDRLITDLISRGHRFISRCDTEVAVHLVEDSWTGMLDKIDGQYAIAAYDKLRGRLLLARDRMGISPLFYTRVGDNLIFASEMKAIFATGLIRAELDPRSLDAIMAFGCVPAPRTMFKGIKSLPPGNYLEAANGCISRVTYWDVPFNDAGDYPQRSKGEWSEEFRDILFQACKRRLKADVPVGVYLSGGIDSSTVAAMSTEAGNIDERVFSIGFPEPGLDESTEARKVSDYLGIKMHLLNYSQSDLTRDMPKMIYHGEMPLISTESVPLLALSELASKHVKVVLTGEGSDESLGGYQFFRWESLKELVGKGIGLRLLKAVSNPLFKRCFGPRNPFFPEPEDFAWANELFGCYPANMMKFLYFRIMRKMVYSDHHWARQAQQSDAEFLQLPLDKMGRWDQLNRSLYISSRIFMTTHLLGSRGDRVLMANSVEGRYPFLDRKLQEFLGTVPPTIKTSWHTEKHLLRRAMNKRLPREVIHRRKKEFLAPFGTPFVGSDATEHIRDLLSPRKINEFGFFDADKVQHLADELEAVKAFANNDKGRVLRLNRLAIKRLIDGVAMTFVVSTQMLADHVAKGNFSTNLTPTF